MNRRLLTGLVVMLIIAAALILGVLALPRTVLYLFVGGADGSAAALRERSAEFGEALTALHMNRIYRLFNSGFRNEIPEAQLDSSIRLWLDGRQVRGVRTTHLEVKSLSGLVSSTVIFTPPDSLEPQRRTRFKERDRQQEYLFQYWIRTSEGWCLMWLNKVLDPIAMDYGHTDSSAMGEVRQLALNEALTNGGIQKQVGLTQARNRLVLLSHGADDRKLQLPETKIVWLSKDSISALGAKLGVNYYLDILPTRTFQDVAIASLDIIPVPPYTQGGRSRNIRLFFVRDQGKWRFADYGVKW
jgi:hypothetical protein